MALTSQGAAPDRDGVAASEGFSLVRDDRLFRLQRQLGLIPPTGLAIARRVVFYSMLCWLPLMIWAWWVLLALVLTVLVAVPLLCWCFCKAYQTRDEIARPAARPAPSADALGNSYEGKTHAHALL
ncbi:hypothetical protein SB751_20420 [Cupriavidus sp. SIMBA_020]|uniref:hypothetical protein n=1 Tax=Cupriavidus sp. SIMBA_020 TaxID=3085766 RepID=UPI003978F247